MRFMKMKKRNIFFSGLLAFVLIFVPMTVLGVTGGSDDAPDIRLVIDGFELTNMSAPPIAVNGRTLVPFRDVFQHVGGTVGWHSANRQVSLFFGDDILVLTIGETAAILNGQIIQMDVAPTVHNERTMVPLRFPSEAFGFDVSWNSTERTVMVNTPNGNNGNDTASPTPTPEPNPNVPDISSIPIVPLQSVSATPEEPAENYNDEYYELSDKEDTPWESSKEGDELPPPGVTVATGEEGALAVDVSAFPIQTMMFPQTTVTSLRTPVETGMAAYVAVASLPISGVQYFLLPDNRLVVDIHNAVSLISGDFYAPANLPVTEVRASQFSNTPRVTRMVFQVVGEAEFSVALSADRTLLTVAFSQNRISSIFTASDAFSDTLFIQGDILPAINISTEGFPRYITININNAQMLAGGGVFANGVFAHSFVAGQRNDGSAYVRVYVGEEWPSFSLAQSADSVAFMMHHGISGVRYDSVNRQLRISRDFSMDISQLQRNNDYLRFQYTFVLPAAADVLGRGEITVLDGFVNSVNLARDVNGNVLLTFNTARVLSFSIREEANYYVISVHLPRDVSPFLVVIDPGHGGSDPGAIHHGVVEKDLVLDVSFKVMQLLEADPFITAYMTRRTDTYVSLLDRAEFANTLGADMFVSIHANAAADARRVPNPVPHGIETFYAISPAEAAQNHNMNSRQLGQIMQRNLISASGANNRNLRHAPNFVVLRETNMPAVLIELGFLTNPEEAARLATIEYQWQLAHAIYQSIVEAFATHPPRR